MKLQIDTEAKTVAVLEAALLSEVFDFVRKLDGGKDYRIVSQETKEPIFNPDTFRIHPEWWPSFEVPDYLRPPYIVTCSSSN